MFLLQTAELLFFVVDNQTRSTASMVEAAYLAGNTTEIICASPQQCSQWPKVTDLKTDLNDVLLFVDRRVNILLCT